MDTAWRVLTRKKILDSAATEQTELGRVLSTIDLTALGVGSTLGVGVYVLAGHVAKDIAGPAVVLSFLIATVASVFAGLCYAEFGARTPRAGSAYIYSYVCVGEFVAFVIGWNLILEYVIGSASVARGLSLYLDTLINNTLKDTFMDIAPLGGISFMSAYFDFFAFGISLLLAVALSFGLKESSKVNNIVTLINLMVVAFVIIAGAVKADTSNWDIHVTNSTNSTGTGGFFPFGVEGMIKGAATCFYGFVGFDCIATTGEEVRNPKRAIPFSIVLSLFIIFLAYFGTSTVVTLMVPYYDQDPNAPLPHAFATVGMEWAKWVVAIGGMFGLCASLFGAMFPLPRIIYAMASDSLIFRFLGRVSPRFKTPVVGTLLAGLLTGLMAALFELKQLVNMMSIGTLLAYTIVAASVLLLRYTDQQDENNDEIEMITSDTSVVKQVFNCGRYSAPSDMSQNIVKFEVCLYSVLCVAIGLCAMNLHKEISNLETWAIVLTSVFVGLALLLIISIALQPQSKKALTFKVPWVPLIPALSILINIYLMLMLDANTWIRFGVWMAVGIPTYYFSVKIHTDARNESIHSTRSSTKANGKLNGYTNNGYVNTEPVIVETTPKKKPAPPPPTIRKIEATIAALDEILDNEQADIDRKLSLDSLSTNSHVLFEENVQADVHCSDVPLESVSLVQSSVSPEPVNVANVTEENPSSDSPAEQIKNIVEPVIIVTPEVITELTPQEPNAPPPPPPPIITELEDVPVNIPRPKFWLSGIADVKLKSVEIIPKSPPVDYSRQTSYATDDNIKFGTPEHKEFLERLNNQLQAGYSVEPPPKPKPGTLSPVPSAVIADSINKNEAKDRLVKFLERTDSVSLGRNRVGEVVRKAPDSAADLSEYQNQHRQNMQTIFRSVRLRKEDSFEEDKAAPVRRFSEKEAVDDESDEVRHKDNMNDVFASIRLRKVDSFKNNESQ